MPKETRVWKTIDGCFFETETEAGAYEAKLLRRKRVTDFLREHGFNGKLLGHVEDMIMKNVDELRRLLA